MFFWVTGVIFFLVELFFWVLFLYNLTILCVSTVVGFLFYFFMSFLSFCSKNYSLTCVVLRFFLSGEGLCLVLEFLTCTVETWSMLFFIFLSVLWFFFILFFIFCSRVFIAVIFVCVGLFIASVYARSFFAIFSTVLYVLFCFIIVNVEEYFCGLSCISFCYITDVHGIKFGFLVFSLFEKTIFVTVIFFKCWIFCFMVFYLVCCM